MRSLETDLHHRCSYISEFNVRIQYHVCLHMPFLNSTAALTNPPPPSTFVFRALDLFLPRDGVLPRYSSEAVPCSVSAAGTSTSNFPIPRCPGAGGIEISERMLWGGPKSMGGWSSASCEIGVADCAGAGVGEGRSVRAACGTSARC